MNCIIGKKIEFSSIRIESINVFVVCCCCKANNALTWWHMLMETFRWCKQCACWFHLAFASFDEILRWTKQHANVLLSGMRRREREREKDWHFFGQLFISFTLNLMVFLLSRNHCLNMHNISIVSVPTFLDRFLWCAAMKVPGSNNNEISFSINYQFMYSTKVNMRKEKQSVHI